MEVRGGRYTSFSNYFQYLYLINGIISASNLTSISKYLVYLVVQIKKIIPIVFYFAQMI